MTRDEVIEETLRRVVEYFSPLHVYLFGSSARGDMHPRSDIDLLVVVPDDAPAEKLSGGIYNQLAGLPLDADVIAFRERDFKARQTWRMSLPALVLREGKLVYDAQSVRAR